MAINAWEKRKLGDVTKLITKGTTPRKQNGQGTINFIKVENISKGGNISVTNKISFEEHQGYLARSVLQENDILFSIAGSLGRTAIISKSLLPANTNQALAIIRLGSGDVKFVATYLSGTAVNEYIKRNPTTGAQPNISLTQVASLHIDWPCLDEQRTIAKLFSKVNNLIAATQGKLDQLQMVKKALLQHFFDQSMRFKGYSDPWEKCKLGDIAEKVTEKNKSGEFKEVLTNSAENGIVSQRDFFDKDIANKESLSGYYVVRPDDFVYNPRISNSAPVGPIKRNRLKRIGIMSPLYFVFRVHGVNHGFLEQYFLANVWHRFMTRNGDTGARSDRFAIKDSVFVTMPILIPSVAEQQHIASSLQTLDGLIAAAQSKLVGYRQLKKSLLQELFV
ncbi:restriction endonuclease subunit S [Lacticaseibacillus casei]|uniref:restriction endonuclease subunit S n=1 Tax=Lacticaseibacillus casei TaxID=1582 RepID=UPI00080BA3FA|nr:restriction endonuclease subunit S [Lacticaseibacillus casei]